MSFWLLEWTPLHMTAASAPLVPPSEAPARRTSRQDSPANQKKRTGGKEVAESTPPPQVELEQPVSLLKARTPKDFVARLLFVGIFITENIMHAYFFELEVDSMVAPALAPLPREVAVCLHIVHIVFGMFGAIFVVVSGFDTAGRTALTKGTSMMLVFMSTITWTWWINRKGVPYWELEPPYPFWDIRCSDEKRNRTVHILKNLSIVGALTMLQQMAKYEREASPCRPSFLEGLVTALRPWTFTATIGPQLVSLAVLHSLLHKPLPGYTATFMLLLALIAVQVSSNLINSYKDFKKGVDRVETAGDRTLVDNLVSMSTLKALIAFSLAWWISYFVWSIIATKFNQTVLGLCLLGAFLAIGYTAGPAPLKYLGLGDVAVFLGFGPAVLTYSSIVLVGEVPSEVLWFTVAPSLYVVGTLHANNYRDIDSDKQAGARTVATILGPKLSLHYYTLLLLGAHVTALYAGYCFRCIGVVASLITLPLTAWLLIRIRINEKLGTQDEETAKTMLIFCVAMGLGIITMPGLQFSPLGFAVTGLVVAVLKVFAN